MSWVPIAPAPTMISPRCRRSRIGSKSVSPIQGFYSFCCVEKRCPTHKDHHLRSFGQYRTGHLCVLPLGMWEAIPSTLFSVFPEGGGRLAPRNFAENLRAVSYTHLT